MNLKEEYTQKMLKEKLDFLPLIESLKLLNSRIKLTTEFWWVMSSEEITNNGDDLTIEEILSEYDELFGLDNKDYLRVGRKGQEFDEFTFDFCPAPTYIDLIK